MSQANGNAKSLLKNTGIFAIGTFGSKVLVLLVIPLCTHFIDTDGMGVYDMVYTVAQLLYPIAVLAVPESLFRWLLDEHMDKREVYSSWLAMFFGFLMVFSTIYWLVYLVIRFDDAGLLYAIVIATCAYSSAQYGTRGMHSNRLFAIQGIVYAAVYSALSYLLVAHLRIGYTGLLWAVLGATVVSTAFMVIVQPDFRRFSRKLFDCALAKEMLRYSVFLLPNQLSWWALSWLGRLFIVGFLGYAANGIYSVAMKFPSALTMLSSVFMPAWQEQAVTLYGRKSSGEYFTSVFCKYSKLILSLLLPGIPATVLFIHLFMGSSYAPAADIVSILYLGASFSAFSSFYGVLYLCDRDTKGAASTTIVGAAASALASMLLIPTCGIVGAASASTLGNLAMWLTRTRQTKRYCSIAVPWIMVVLLSVSSIFMGLLCGVFKETWQLLLLTVFGVLSMLIVNRDSLNSAKALIHK